MGLSATLMAVSASIGLLDLSFFFTRILDLYETASVAFVLVRYNLMLLTCAVSPSSRFDSEDVIEGPFQTSPFLKPFPTK